MTFEIQHFTLCDGWINTWSDDHGHPIPFTTEKEAQQALNEFFDELQESVERGDMDKHSMYDQDVFRIVPIRNKKEES